MENINIEDQKRKVSVIMSVYNAEHSVERAIDSVLKQSYQNWEFIICNDGSTDNTQEILNQYAKQHPGRFILLKNETNKYLAYSLNRCLEYATGEYVARMDADDCCMEDRFAFQVSVLDAHLEYGVVGCAALISDGESVVGKRIPEEFPTKKNTLLGTPFMHPTIMMRKSIYEALGGYTVANYTRRGQDWDLWFRFFAGGYQGYNIQEPLFVYYETSNNLKNRSLKNGLNTAKIAFYGYKLNKVPIFYYPLLLKPIVAALIPQRIMFFYHNRGGK